MGKNLKGKELGKGISQRKDGTYCARYTDRFGKRQCIYNKKLSELRLELAEAIYENNISLVSIKEHITMDEWFKTWVDVVKADNKIETRELYRQRYNYHIKPTFGNMNLQDISKLHVMNWVKALKEKGLSTVSIRDMVSQLSSLCISAVENDLLLKNPCHNVKIPYGATPPQKKQALKLQEEKDFFRYAKGSHYYNAFVVHVNTGLRPGELFALMPKHINLKGRTIRVEQSMVGYRGGTKLHLTTPKTKSSVRNIPINDTCMKALQNQFELKKRISEKKMCPYSEFTDCIFVTTRNTPLYIAIYRNAIHNIVEKMHEDNVNIPFFAGHCFRHTFATRCFEAGVPPKVIQTYLGHTTIQITLDIYTDTFEDIATAEMSKLDTLNKGIIEMT